MRPHPAWRLLVYLPACVVCLWLSRLLLALAGLADPFLTGLIGITTATWLCVRYLDRGRLLDLGLAWRKRSASDVAVGLSLPVVLLTAVFALEWLAGWSLVIGSGQPAPGLIAAAIWRFGAVAWYEEIFARGYLLQTLSRFTRPGLANLGAALVFAGLHLANPGVSWLAFVGVFLAGLLLGLSYQLTRSLYLPLAFHFSWNLVQAWLGYPVSGTSQPGLLRLVRVGPSLYTGGKFGPEAGLLGVLAICVAAGVILAYVRRR